MSGGVKVEETSNPAGDAFEYIFFLARCGIEFTMTVNLKKHMICWTRMMRKHRSPLSGGVKAAAASIELCEKQSCWFGW